MHMAKGVNTLDWYPADQVSAQVAMYDRVFAGETIEFTAPSEINGETYYFLSIYAPLKNESGKITEAAVFAKDVTATTRAQKHAEKLQHGVSEAREQVSRYHHDFVRSRCSDGAITYVNDKMCGISNYRPRTTDRQNTQHLPSSGYAEITLQKNVGCIEAWRDL